MSDPDLWNAVDDYVSDALGLEDAALRDALDRSREAGLPEIQVSAAQGALLGILARAVGARLVIEIGTLGGYSTICLARGLMPGGRVLTLEVDPTHAAVARTNLAAAGLTDRVEVLEGPALETLTRLRTELQEPVDLVFIDADKLGYADYLAAVRPMCRPGSLILADNLVRKGAVVDASSEDSNVLGARRYNEAVAGDPGIRATVIQTVGSKGHDGLGVAVVTESLSDR